MTSGLVAIVLDCRRAACQILGNRARLVGAPLRRRRGRSAGRPRADPGDRPALWLVELAEHRPGKDRMHLDIAVRDDAHLDELLSLGARVLRRHPDWWTLADPEGNEFDVMNPGY